MAKTATIAGRFAARHRKAWDSFTDNRSQETVAAGRSLVLFVVSDGDDVLEEVKVPQGRIEAAEEATGALAFGDHVELAVEVDRYGSKFVRRVDAPKGAARPAAVAS